jgi:hypothetical protein
MTALAEDRTGTRVRLGDIIERPVLGSTKIYAGGMVARDSNGYCTPATATATKVTLGIAEAQADNSGGGDGDITVKIRRNVVARFGNSASTDLIGAADVGNTCYVVDDQTVAKTNNSNARPAAGKIIDVDSVGVWVEFR